MHGCFLRQSRQPGRRGCRAWASSRPVRGRPSGSGQGRKRGCGGEVLVGLGREDGCRLHGEGRAHSLRQPPRYQETGRAAGAVVQCRVPARRGATVQHRAARAAARLRASGPRRFGHPRRVVRRLDAPARAAVRQPPEELRRRRTVGRIGRHAGVKENGELGRAGDTRFRRRSDCAQSSRHRVAEDGRQRVHVPQRAGAPARDLSSGARKGCAVRGSPSGAEIRAAP